VDGARQTALNTVAIARRRSGPAIAAVERRLVARLAFLRRNDRSAYESLLDMLARVVEKRSKTRPRSPTTTRT